MQKRRGVLLPEKTVLHYFIQICLGLKHIHDRKILYRFAQTVVCIVHTQSIRSHIVSCPSLPVLPPPHSDLKSQNIFLHGAEPNEILNLGDFGIAKGLDNTLANAKTQIGTPYYLSPEICAGKAYSFATDIWSLGVLLYELLTLQMPFNGDSMPALFLNVIKGRPKAISASYSAEMHALLDELLQKDPARRPTIAVLLQRPVLARLIERYLRYAMLADRPSARVESMGTVVITIIRSRHENHEKKFGPRVSYDILLCLPRNMWKPIFSAFLMNSLFVACIRHTHQRRATRRGVRAHGAARRRPTRNGQTGAR